jgi:2-keto-myo-inositol isomerase
VLDKKQFAINRMTYPLPDMENFFQLVAEAGLNKVELRNDLEGKGIIDDLTTSEFNALKEKYKIEIESINAVQKFNLRSNFDYAYKEIKNWIALSKEIGCKALILCPNNDNNDKRTQSQFLADTTEALKKYGKLFQDSGIIGLVEPLGFEECSIRSKKTAIRAIEGSGYKGVYKIVHDTFHHYLGTDDEYYPEYTGLVHISGVEANVSDLEMKDMHRILITDKDRISNKEQIRNLVSLGYKGVFGFEPFSEEIHLLKKYEILDAIKKTINYVIK